ncbi:hypothetical protein SBBP1_250024 [Burkholderiales bacterium]|nr:hypothetical protein SBBP1_250024 [Burkholderiales bacterium]
MTAAYTKFPGWRAQSARPPWHTTARPTGNCEVTLVKLLDYNGPGSACRALAGSGHLPAVGGRRRTPVPSLLGLLADQTGN